MDEQDEPEEFNKSDDNVDDEGEALYVPLYKKGFRLLLKRVNKKIQDKEFSLSCSQYSR